jgi:LPPG:FO 2-phospho-L-lactate transferase
LAPSNPFLSIDPILNCYPIRNLLEDVPEVVVAVSPIVGGKAVKGPAGKMLQELGHEVSAAGVARYYDALLDGFVYDALDGEEGSPTAVALTELDLPLLCTNTMMYTAAERATVAQAVLDFALALVADD